LYVDRLPAAGDSVELDPEETRHAARARRLKTGDVVVLTDGGGSTARAELLSAGRRDVVARVLDREAHPVESPAIHLASALPKGDRIATLLSMVTQLGITTFTPLACRYSVVAAPEAVPARWIRILRESAKQSRRAHLPEVLPPRTPADVVRTAACEASWLMDPAADEALGEGRIPEGAAHLVVVGPEGGLSDDERRMLVADGARPARLGRGVLRVETACVAAVAVLRARARGA
jgi:16S rRNA (uracil1498-N3)-methyltransferase